MIEDFLFLAHLSASLFMTGVIWIVQVVHYPTFKWINDKDFSPFESFHQRRISAVIIPVMLAEALSSIGLLIRAPSLQNILAALCIILIWFSTFFLQVPCHRKLDLGKDSRAIHVLIQSNWIRTILWTTKSGLLISQLNLPLP